MVHPNKRLLLLGACSAALGFAASPALAANATSFVASSGSDTNACTRASPCATVQAAYAATNAGGEIDCVDAGNYGTLTLGHSITINCVGAHATISGVTIDSTGAAFNAVLEGLDINAQQNSSTGTVEGIALQGSGGHFTLRHAKLHGLIAALHIATSGDTTVNLEDVDIDDTDKSVLSEAYGVYVTASGPMHINISSSRIANQGPNSYGIYMGGGPAYLNIDESVISHSQNGVYQAGSGLLMLDVRNSRIVDTRLNGVRLTTAASAVFENSEISGGNNGIALFSSSAKGNPAIVAVIRGTTVGNNSGYGIVAAGTGARAVVVGSTISQNGTGASAQSGAAIYSEGNNDLVLNAANGAFTSAVSPQ